LKKQINKFGDRVQASTSAHPDKNLTVIDFDQLETGETGESGESGKSGESGEFSISAVSNAIFIATVFPKRPEGAFVAVASKPGDPTNGGWVAFRSGEVIERIGNSANNFVGCSSFYPGDDGSFKARKANFAACHFLMLDDLGTKIPIERLGNFKLTWLIETSPGNHQGGIVFSEPLTDADTAVLLLNAVIDAGYCDAGASGPLSRWARLPVAINGKPKYLATDGSAFQCKLIQWNPEARYTPEEIIAELKLELAPAGKPKRSAKKRGVHQSETRDLTDVLIPKADENPVIHALKNRGYYKTPLGSGKHDVTCPWVHEHTDALDTGAAYFEPDEIYTLGGFNCQHSHGEQYRIRQLLDLLGVRNALAKNKPVIRILAGEMNSVIESAEKELASRGRHFQSGGLIVSVATNPVTGDPSIIPTSQPALTRELSICATWEKFDSRADEWVQTDPPTRHTAILFDSQNFRYLPPLIGVARQPYFRESDGHLVTKPGYDKEAQRFGVFDTRQFVFVEPTLQAAKDALALIEDLLNEFHFVAPRDRSAAISAIFTASVRTTLAHAPAFHVRAPVIGSGKSYLCELIGAFAGAGGNAKVSYPTTSEEATKSMLALLLTSPAVIEFDDMDTDWIPHGTINRMLTSEQISDRVLGVSKVATVSTRTLVMGSGNNVGPVRDLLRRVVTIHIDPRCSTPATLSYGANPVDKVRKNRGKYVSAVFTIILAYRKAGMPRAIAENIVTFGGAWSDYCRFPLMWLGFDDPASSLIEQIRHDPDGDALAGLMTEWYKAFSTASVTVRQAIKCADNNLNLKDAMLEFPVEERSEINPKKLGWILKKNADRIVGQFHFSKSRADGRMAWRVVIVKTPSSPVLPLSPVLASQFKNNAETVEVAI